GAAVTLRFTEASIQHAPEAGPGGALRIMSMDEAGEDALGKARALHGAQALRCDRGMWDFLKLLRTEYAEPFAVLRGEEPVGYLADQENYLCEFACADGVDPAAAVSAFMRHKSAKDAQLVMPLHTLHREARLMAAADSWHIGPSFMARVLDWQAFLSALLRHAAATRTLREGEALLGIRGHGSYRLRVSGNGAEVEAVKTPAEFTLDARDAVAMLTLPLGNAMHPGNPLRDWLPLPFYMSELDSF
ncbi:MAG TPA: hypothetical protein VLA21_10500, partial [Candidatus Limnocylindria bacterium]|nr:hypothetical protein [Candidatus Limnocylindria bacterium]